MKFVTLGNKSVRADRIEAVQMYANTVTIYCINGNQYIYHFNNQNDAKAARDKILAELEKIKIGD